MSEVANEPDVVDVWSADHQECFELLGQIWEEDDPGRRRDFADTVISEVVRHAAAEEMYVYPAMREHLPDGEAAVAHDIDEHRRLPQPVPTRRRPTPSCSSWISCTTSTLPPRATASERRTLERPGTHSATSATTLASIDQCGP